VEDERNLGMRNPPSLRQAFRTTPLRPLLFRANLLQPAAILTSFCRHPRVSPSRSMSRRTGDVEVHPQQCLGPAAACEVRSSRRDGEAAVVIRGRLHTPHQALVDKPFSKDCSHTTWPIDLHSDALSERAQHLELARPRVPRVLRHRCRIDQLPSFSVDACLRKEVEGKDGGLG